MKYIFLLITLFLISCSNKTYQKFDYNYSKNPWIEAFKDHVFFAALKESYKKDSIFYLIEKKDVLNPYDGLSIEAIKKAKFLGQQLIVNMPLPIMCEGCKDEMNYYLANSLHYYNSIELDSIAKKEFKIYIKENRKLGFK